MFIFHAQAGDSLLRPFLLLTGRKEVETPDWLPSGKITVGITAGASCPNNLIEDTIRRLFELGGFQFNSCSRTEQGTADFFAGQTPVRSWLSDIIQDGFFAHQFALAKLSLFVKSAANQSNHMNENYHPFYKHSGKFGVHGPLLALLAAVVAGYPLGIIYAYLIKWIPFIYLNLFITAGYGLAFGFMTMALLKFAKVRNSSIALLTGLAVGLCAAYLSWNGFLHAMAKEPPAL